MISPQAAEEYRRAVFASQTAIATKDDLQNFSRKYLQAHGHPMPFVIDPNGLFAAEVNADYTLGERIGLQETPTIFVVTQKNWVQIKDVTLLDHVIESAIAQTASSTPAPVHSGVKKPTTVAR